MTPQHLGSEQLVTLDQMRARLAELDAAALEPRPTAEPSLSPTRSRLRERVVLLDYFAASALEPSRHRDTRTTDRDSGSPEVNDFVVQDCELVTTKHETGWRLRLDVRRETLARIGPRGALASLGARDALAAGSDDVTHRMARRLVEGERDLDHLSATELSGILRARDWLEGLEVNLPAEADVRRALDLANVLAPLRSVARPDFVGRDAELAMLEAFVASDGEPEALAIHGPGGVGKSALVAKFVLDHVEGRTQRLTFAYLTFDRAELDPQFPLTLVREMCRQIALQAPQVADRTAIVIRDIDSQLAADVALRRELSSSRGTGLRDIYRSQADEGYFLSELAHLVRAVSGDAPFLMVLDTFEVAQRRRRSSLTILDSTLRGLRQQLPAVRIVIAGRAEARELTPRQQPLGGLTPEQAQHLLRLAVGTMPVSDTLVADVADRVSGNPLSLRLAADLMLREGGDVLATRRGRRRFLFGLRAEQVQGILYRRILDHVDTAIQPLANPGLVVRRITREVIAEVLAKPCGLGTLTGAQAMTLFDKLRIEISLVTETSPGVLVHRADVRREMLPLLETDDHARVVEIHRRAVTYYGGRGGTDDRTEHLYHRLMLGQSTATLDKHWDPVIGPLLEPAMPELPASSRVYLAGKLPDVEADPADLAAADHASWMRQVSRQTRRLLDAGQSFRALELLSAKPGTGAADDPAVSMLLIEALASSARRKEALAVATDAITNADERGLARDYVALSILAGRVAEDDDDFVASGRYFAEARESARDLGARTAALTAGAGALRIARRSGQGGPRGSGAQGARGGRLDEHRLRGELIAEVATLTEREKSLNPGLLRELAAELGDSVPGLLADAATHVGVETESKRTSELSDHARDTINKAVWDHSGVMPPEDPDGLPPDQATTSLSSAVKGRAVAEALKLAPGDLDLQETVTQYWRSEADRPSFDYYDDQGK